MRPAVKIAISVLSGFILASYLFWELPLISRNANEIIIKIPKEEKTAKEVLSQLHKERILKHPKLFRLTLSLFRWDKKIQRGTYKLRKNEAWPTLIRKLTRGETYGIKVTIPEGWRAEQIAERLEALGVSDAKGFLEIVHRENSEGFLFPSTYFLEPNLPASEAIGILRSSFDRAWQENFLTKNPPMRFTKRDVIILASIIERETTVKEEKPIIAGVYLNRLQKNWRLEADPTVQYALGYWKNKTTYQDLKIKSPYNTYQRYGLPIGPISNPGLESIAAVFDPTQTNYMYFIAKGDGTHTFLETLKEHNREKALKKRAKRARLKAL